MWNECNCAIVWTFFGIAFPWDWNENWPFPVLWPLLSFPNCWHIEHSTLTASSLRIWNSSAGISSLPLALFVVMFPKVYHARNLRLSSSDTLIRYDPLNLFVTSTARDLIWVIPEWPSGFPYFLQFKPLFSNKEFIICAIVSSQSCFCWLYIASPSLAAKKIINLISVLTIWWCPCGASFPVFVGRRCLLWPTRSLNKTLLAFALLHFILQVQIFLLFLVSLDFLLSIPVPYDEKDICFGVSYRRSWRSL